MKKTVTDPETPEPTPSFMSIFPYWLKVPSGWNYPAACSSGIAGKGGWSASVDQSSRELLSI